MDIESGHIDHPFISVDETLLRARDDGKRMGKPVIGASGGGKYHRTDQVRSRSVPDSSPGWGVPGAPFFDRQVMTLVMVLSSSAETVLDRRVS